MTQQADEDFWASSSPAARLATAITALARGGMIVVADGRDREDEADLIMSASGVTEGQMAFSLRWGSGIVCIPMSNARADDLGLQLMVEHNTDPHHTAFTVTVDSMATGTGISAADRATTARALAHPRTRPADLRRPGHILPLRARPGGVLKRAGHTEAATDLLRLAGAGDVGIITELVDDSGVPLHGQSAVAFAREHGLPFLCVEDLVQHLRNASPLVARTGVAALPLGGGRFSGAAYASELDGVEHFVLTLGDVAAAGATSEGLLVRVHSECLTGDVFGSLRCDCGQQLQQSLSLIETEGVGVMVYLRGQEGRGIGLGHKLQAYALQDEGHDTVDANKALGLPVDSREYGIGAAILADLGVARIRLITNNPQKHSGLSGYGLQVIDRVRTTPSVNVDNIAYLQTKRDRMGHDLHIPPLAAQA